MQLHLALRYAGQTQAQAAIAAALASRMVCAHYRLRLQRAECVAAQTNGERCNVAMRDGYCASGRCLQGRVVLLEERLVERKRCERCGNGWIIVEKRRKS